MVVQNAEIDGYVGVHRYSERTTPDTLEFPPNSGQVLKNRQRREIREPNVIVISADSHQQGEELLRQLLLSVELEDPFTHKITRKGKKIDELHKPGRQKRPIPSRR